MAHTTAFDTLRWANRLKEVGVPDKQAERQAELIAETINIQLATKQDLVDVKKDIIIWLGGIIVVVAGITIEILSFIIKAH
jgi:hypothetical protein